MTQKCARIGNTNFHILPNELQMQVFREYLSTGDEDVCILVRTQQNALTMRLVCKSLSVMYLEPVSRCAVYNHMQKREVARKGDNDLTRSMINASMVTADSNTYHMYEVMAAKNGKAAFAGLKGIKKMHGVQNERLVLAGMVAH